MANNLENEIWLPIKGFEGLYEISNTCKVKSLPKIVFNKGSGGVYQTKGKIKKLTLEKGKGYVICNLGKDGKNKTYPVHRLISIAFIPNPENKREVNHKNGIRHDNRLENLEWVTPKENQVHSWEKLGRKSPSIKNNNKRCRKVKCDTLDIEFLSVCEAKRQLGLNANINKVLSGERNHTQGLTFRYI